MPKSQNKISFYFFKKTLDFLLAGFPLQLYMLIVAGQEIKSSLTSFIKGDVKIVKKRRDRAKHTIPLLIKPLSSSCWFKMSEQTSKCC